MSGKPSNLADTSAPCSKSQITQGRHTRRRVPSKAAFAAHPSYEREQAAQLPTSDWVLPYRLKTESREITPSNWRELARLTTGTIG
jgi:hypothetical protein